MRMLSLVVGLCLLLCGSAAAQSAFLFRGPFIVISKSATCVGNLVGNNGVMRFRISGSGSGSSFALHEDSQSQAFRLQSGLFDTGFKTVQTMTVTTRFAASANPVSVRFTQQFPAVIGATTNFVSLVGRIRGYGSVADCVVGFRAALVKNLD